MPVDNIERLRRYGQQNTAGGPVTAAEVLAEIALGMEDSYLTPGQRKRKRLKRGGTRRALNGWLRGPHPSQFVLDEAFPSPQVVEVFGQVWEMPPTGRGR